MTNDARNDERWQADDRCIAETLQAVVSKGCDGLTIVLVRGGERSRGRS